MPHPHGFRDIPSGHRFIGEPNIGDNKVDAVGFAKMLEHAPRPVAASNTVHPSLRNALAISSRTNQSVGSHLGLRIWFEYFQCLKLGHLD